MSPRWPDGRIHVDVERMRQDIVVPLCECWRRHRAQGPEDPILPWHADDCPRRLAIFEKWGVTHDPRTGAKLTFAPRDQAASSG